MANVPGKTDFFTALTTAWLALAVIFAGLFIIEEHDHDCVGENCHICLEIQIAQRLIEAFGRLGVSIAVTGFFLRSGSWIKPRMLFYPRTPIELRVRLNC
ncbi:MAG: hypothetical protein LBE74_05105 [Treponema sp.]|jgi:hypothetical protein|nr:hypothetical protein [Treponema sp.]